MHQDLADMLGLHLTHLNRILSRLRARGLMLMHGQEITLPDRDGLSDLAPVASHAPRPGASHAHISLPRDARPPLTRSAVSR